MALISEALKILFRKKPKLKRLELRFVSYEVGEALLKQGWRLALPEEDNNRTLGMVYLERVERPPERPTYWAVKDPDGHIVHTFLAVDQQDVIDDWLDTERCTNVYVNASRMMTGLKQQCTPSWEQFEAEGYSVVRVKLVEAP